MIPETVLKKISDIVGAKHLKTAEENLAEYGTDASKLEFMPEAVAFPASSEEISRILSLATETGLPVIPRGAGSGMSGGALPVKGGLVIAMNRFDRIFAIDQDNLIAKVEPGVITAHLQEAVEKVGLFYPPDPASIKISTIGGNVAECAGGLRAVKYGVTRDYVLGLKVVLPTGEIINTGVETMKGVAGYDLTRLIIGSEGTLAVITSITLRLIPLPAAKRTMIAFFPDVSSAVQTVSDIIRNRIVPTILEFLDSLCIDCVREDMDLAVPEGAGAMLLIEVDGDEGLVERDAKTIGEVCSRGGAVRFEAASGSESANRLWEARRNVSPALFKLRPHKINEDVVVPRSKMAELVAFLDELARRYGLPIPAFGHAGDGNIHVNIMLDRGDPGQLNDAQTVVKELFKKVIEMGGTITGEHGIGVTKAPYLEMEISRAGLDLMSRIKQAFDPKGILNPGKIFSQTI
ncbi:MAG: FAD-binding protein [Proteobacteria bacterium]|nr:FAD-binding protein [Desulfobacterales bacterium]MBL7101508.1 FAD-binding protein [Desulfobacteraceae bacterium]MBL7171357.1 FAD-binding protein [Desulfobacteraceae bacterium]MBU0733974.1 FAD-binding protein [Pseudomonadota bacterium]MBU1904591.1 FAD-binding protein [Pseudomonadota bacterium]